MSIRSAIATVLVCTLLLSTVGASLGVAIGKFAPGYYRLVFRIHDDPGFDPASIGLGLGLTQGATAGVIVGLAIVATLCWRQTRTHGAANSRLKSGTESFPAKRSRSVLRFVASLFALGICSSCSFFVGGLLSEVRAYHNQYLDERDAFEPILARDPDFTKIKIDEDSGGGAYLRGEVPTAAALDRLEAEVRHAVGASRAKEVMRAVRPKP